MFALCCCTALCTTVSIDGIQAAEPLPEYIADALAGRITSTQDWGELGLNTAAFKAADGPPKNLRIKDTEYRRGLGHHANGEIVVALDGQYTKFECQVGIQWQGGKNIGSVVCQVFADEKKLFESGVLRENDAAKKISISVDGASELRLVATDAGNGIACDCVAWAEARLTPASAATRHAVPVAVDIAPFGCVVASDPSRIKGTTASRVQEIPAEDVFLDSELKPARDGSYTVPTKADGQGCIGVRWVEPRRLQRLELHWADAAAMPKPDTVQLQVWTDVSPTQFWTGSSPWQGRWKPLNAKFEQSQQVWTWQITAKDQPTGAYRVRWIFQASQRPIVVHKISAYCRASWATANLRLELHHPTVAKPVQAVVYNGNLLDGTEPQVSLTRSLDLSKPLTLSVRYSRPNRQKTDRTVLRFEFPEQPVSIAVEDVVAHGSIYVPCVGLFASLESSNTTLDQYLQKIAGQKTVLEQVRMQPDQSLSQAMAKTHNPTQKGGPMLLALACDNRKYIVDREGPIHFDLYDAPDGDYPNFPTPQQNWIALAKHFRLVPQFGGGKASLSRRLDQGWLPKPITTATDNGVTYSQCTFVAPVDKQSPDGCPTWYRHRAVCVAEYVIENTLPTEANAALKLTLLQDGKSIAGSLQKVKDGYIAVHGDRLLAFLDASHAGSLTLNKPGDGISLTGTLAAGKSAKLFVYLPAWPVKSTDYAALSNATRWERAVEGYWNELLSEAMQIDVPDPLLANLIRASQMHCMIVARNEDRGQRVAPWIAAISYGPLESEAQAIIRGMDMCGHADFARRGLEFFLKRYNQQGFLTTGYTLCGTGEHLWTLAEHHARCDDREWLKTNAPQLVKTCKWIIGQRAKTKGNDADGRPLPEYGLMPPGVTADWERYAYRFFNDAQYCHGLETVGQSLATIGHPEAAGILADAKLYREDLLRAYRWTQARSPVVALGNGTWVPNHPAMLDVFGNVEEMIAPNEDANRSWCYSVEIGSHHLAANRLLDPLSADVAQMMDYLEDHQFLRSGWFDYMEEQNHKDAFNFGGFSKVQPYYSRNAEICALRDDVKPFLRSYFNAVSTLLNEENLSLWEHFHNAGAWNKTHETGWFLCQTAMLFTAERGDELWLAPMVTNRWLEDGKTVAVRNAPTRFGPVSYAIVSHAGQGHIDASIEPPKRNPPKQIVIRIRHPESKPLKSVTVDGKPHADFYPTTGTVRIAPTAQPIRIRAEY